MVVASASAVSDVVVVEGGQVAVSGLGGDPVDRGILDGGGGGVPGAQGVATDPRPPSPAAVARLRTRSLTVRGPMPSRVMGRAGRQNPGEERPRPGSGRTVTRPQLEKALARP